MGQKNVDTGMVEDDIVIAGTIEPTEPGEGTFSGVFTKYERRSSSCLYRMTASQSDPFTFIVNFHEENGSLFLEDSPFDNPYITIATESVDDGWCESGIPLEFGEEPAWRVGTPACYDTWYQNVGPIVTDPVTEVVTASRDVSGDCPHDENSNPDWTRSYRVLSALTAVEREPTGNCDDADVWASFDALPDATGENNQVALEIDANSPGSTYQLRRHSQASWETVLPGTRSITYDAPGEYIAQLLVTDSEGCTATDSVRFTAGAITAYAPTIWFHPAEQFFPGSANDFVQRSQLIVWRHKQCGGKRYYAAGVQARDVGGVDQPRLNFGHLSGKSGRVYVAEKSRRTWGGCERLDGKAKANGAPKEFVLRHNDKWKNSSGFYLNLLNRDEWRAGDELSARVYYIYKHEKYVAYWIFWPYNRWTGSGVTEIHEGDWEHVVIRLGDRNLASRSAFYQHNCAQAERAWSSTPRDEPGSTHPALFAALGGHASYSADPADIDADDRQTNCSMGGGVGDVWADRIGIGTSWEPWKGQLTRAKLQLWWGFGGAWGDVSSESTNLGPVDNYGPPAPGPSNLGVPKRWR